MKKTRFLAGVALLLAAVSISACTLQHQQAAFREKLIRLHVVANSDSRADQARKLQVRDAVLALAEPLLEEAEDPEKVLRINLPRLQRQAERCLRRLGCEDAVRVSLGRERFPTRVYDSFALPAGVYRSLRVTIGAGEGHNWWCVVFPSICFRASAEDLEEAASAGGFSRSEVRLITGDGSGYRLKFRILELLEALQRRLS